MKNKLPAGFVSFKSIIIVLILNYFVPFEAIAQSNFSKENGVVTDNVADLQWQDDYEDNNNEIKTGTYTELQSIKVA